MVLDDVGLDIVVSIEEDPETHVPQVNEVEVRLHVEDFYIEAVEGSHIKLYNKVFGLVRFVVRKVRHECCTQKPRAPASTLRSLVVLKWRSCIGCCQCHQYCTTEEAGTGSQAD